MHRLRRVTGADGNALRLGDGGRLGFDLLVWAGGAAPPQALSASQLRTDERGFVLVRTSLQLEGHDDVFASGDCAAFREFPDVPKAGVYAVRQGPVLASNLRALLEQRPLRHYRPQREFLTLVNFGDGTAAGSKWGVTSEGRWVMRLKDRIDRRFVARYRLAGGSTERNCQTR